MDYNFTKGGVDTVDLMCSRISTSRRTQRWPMTIFFRLLDQVHVSSTPHFEFWVKTRGFRLCYVCAHLCHKSLRLCSISIKIILKIPLMMLKTCWHRPFKIFRSNPGLSFVLRLCSFVPHVPSIVPCPFRSYP